MSRSYIIVVVYGFGSPLNREIMKANVNRTNILSYFLYRVALLFKESMRELLLTAGIYQCCNSKQHVGGTATWHFKP